MTKPAKRSAEGRKRRKPRRPVGEGPVGAPDAVPVELTLRWGDEPVTGDDPLAVRARAACANAVDRLLAELGIPGRTTASVTLAGPSAPEPYVLRVNGRRSWLARGDLDAIVTDLARPGTALETLPETAVADLAAAVCVAALHRRLSVLLREDHVARILTADGMRVCGMPLSGLASALAILVDNGVSLAPIDKIEDVLRSAGGTKSTTQLAELVIDKLQPLSVNLLFASNTMRRVTTANPDRQDLFTEMRIRIFDNIGMSFPDFHFVIDDEIPDGCFAFRVNAVATWPRHLKEGEGLGEVAAALELVLRRNAAWFNSLSNLDELLGQLRALPDTVKAVKTRFPKTWLSAVARAALDENLPEREISTLLDWIIDLDPQPLLPGEIRLVDGPAPIGFADGNEFPLPRDAVALIRQRWREELVWTLPSDLPQHARYLPADLEHAAEDGSLGPDDSGLEQLALAVRTMLDADQTTPIVVPTLALRSRLRDALAPEFPDLQVFAEQEFPPYVRLLASPPHVDARPETQISGRCGRPGVKSPGSQ